VHVEHRASGVAAALLTACALCGCETGSSPSDRQGDPWRAVADERGFTDALEGKDFFAAARFGCVVDTAEPPATLQGLADESDLVVLGSIVEVVAVFEQPSPDPSIQEEIQLRVEIEDIAKGESAPSILVQESCGTGGKIAPLRDRIPASSFVFFLNGPTFSGSRPEPVFQLMYYYLGIVAESSNGLRFALGADGASPSLTEYDSLQAIIDVVARTR
jgi:hypothetical protein